MTITDARDVNTVLLWVMGKSRLYHEHPSDAEATEAARRLAGKAHKTLLAGLKPDDVVLNRSICSSAMAGVQAYFDMDARAHGEDR